MDSEKDDNLRDKTSHGRNNRPLLIVIILLLFIIIWLLIKPPVPLLPRPPLHEDSPGPEKPQKERMITGIVTAYKNNPHLDVNALELKTKTSGTVTIDFRPHTAEAVTRIGTLGQTVTLTYSLHPNDEVVGYQLMAIENKRSGIKQILKDLPPPPDVPNHQTQNFTLDKPVLITDQYGGIVALHKNDLLFHFKPGLVDDIAPLIKENNHFDLVAVRRPDDQGFINVNHDKVYIVLSITINNKTFLVR
ncbi:hypothetical protein [Mucilaginibacter rubeus]|uniref:Uncharacterized protein n=1 Tax=Mucilaginibacter rubeus TaxID=2027860 RepID=A0A5C1HVV0_9SPHI|nr:hypothetical protein [Mucilaginibacter rubeus]QEM10007.1 hypothetical protein DEO27_008220 [Mucilaginibacter rubeus]